MPGNGIFISYRRDDTSGYAGRLYDRLVGRFGDDRVFMDIDRIAPGHEFATDIEKALIDCDACVVLIGRQWLSITDAEGHRRLDDPTDFVRLEVATAIRRGITIFPVLVDRANAPASAALPDDIRALAGRQAIELTNERWNYDTGRLLLALQEELAPTEPPREPKPPKPPKRERPRRSPKRPALIAGGVLLALALAFGTWVATRSDGGGTPGGGGGGHSPGPEAPTLSGTYAVTMELTKLKGTLGPDNVLWEEPNPVVGESGDGWDSQTWIFAGNGTWRVAQRPKIVGALESDGSYTDTARANCSSEPDGKADVTRHLVPTTGSPGPVADSFRGQLTIHWNCAATGPIDATFAINGTHSISLSDYSANVETLLRRSADVRTQLNSVLNEIDATSALDLTRPALRTIISSRSTMLGQASTWEVPPGAEGVNRRLVKMLRVSLVQDKDWLRYVNARLGGDSATANTVYASIQQSPTDSVKASFLDAYNELRKQSGEHPLPSDYFF